MSDFLTIFKDSIVSTIEGLTGVVPEIEHIDSEDNVIELETPITQMLINVSGDKEGTMSLLLHANLATALADMMLGGEGEPKDNVDDDDLDAVGEIMSNILGAFSTSLSAQTELPNLSFSVVESAFLDDAESIDTSSYASVYVFQISIVSLSLPIFLLVDEHINPIIKGEDSNSDETNDNKVPNDKSLSDQELANINLLLDVKLPIKVRIGSKTMLLKDVTNMDIGSVIELDQLANESLDVLVGEKVIAKGEVVIVDGNFGVQITEIGTIKERLEQLR